MPDLLRLFWPLINAPDPVFNRHLVASWPDGALERLIELGIIQEAGTVTEILCPQCFEHDEEVIALDYPDGRTRYMIACPEVLRLEIPPEMLQQWAVNVKTVAAQLARSLQLVGAPVPLKADLVWRLGRGTLEGYLRDFLFVRGRELNDVELRSICSAALRPVVLFTCEPPLGWQDGKIPTMAIWGNATCGPHGIDFDRLALAALVSQAENRSQPNSFRRRGEFWELTFAGEQVHLKDSVGLFYIARLLTEPHRDIRVMSLLASHPEIEALVSAGTVGEVLDDAARVSYSQRYRELCDELELAERNNDLSQLDTLSSEKDQLLSELARATGLGGRSRNQSDADKIRRSVTMAVTRDVERISKAHPTLGEHLRTSISMGLVFHYAPRSEVHWLT